MLERDSITIWSAMHGDGSCDVTGGATSVVEFDGVVREWLFRARPIAV